ncbi:MAG: hypothetical protein ABSE95_09445 [Thermodesulfobacteriota bacterium]|jgi:hypothetical protein
MISEAPSAVHSDYYYKNKNGSFFNSTRVAFSDAGTYAQDNTPAAYRLFWSYGPTKEQITIIAITPHP